MRWIFCSFLLFTQLCFSQKDTNSNNIVLFTGYTLTADSLRAVPFVNLKNQNKRILGMSDEKGHFDILAKKGDTIYFTLLDNKTDWHIIPDTIKGNRFYLIKLITQDTNYYPTIYVRGMPPLWLFDRLFVTKDIPDDAYERARKNLEAEAAKDLMKERPNDPVASQNALASARAAQLYYYKQAPPQNYFSPYAWQQFIQAWKRGDYKKKKKK